MKWVDIIGKKIVALRGFKDNRPRPFGKEYVTLTYILFDDRESFLELKEQDRYEYHDCCDSARILNLRKDAKQWEQMYNQEKNFRECEPGYDLF